VQGIFSSTSDLVAAKAAFIEAISQFGLDSTKFESFTIALQGLASTVSVNATQEQIATFDQKKEEYLTNAENVITGQPGLENLFTDASFQNDTAAKEFIAQFNGIRTFLSSGNRAAIVGFFANSTEVTSRYVAFLKAMKAVSDKFAMTGKKER
jgi:hypothetical protein